MSEIGQQRIRGPSLLPPEGGVLLGVGSNTRVGRGVRADGCESSARPGQEMMLKQQLEADYLIIGAGAMGMAFADELQLQDPQCSIIIVDRHASPGGHWGAY